MLPSQSRLIVSIVIACYFQYILTPSVKKNLKDLVRVVSLSNHPILLQGDTSVGKTSLISFLASASGNKCLRINNHEHTDLQEYIGAYSVDAENGQLVFKEGEYCVLPCVINNLLFTFIPI